MPMSSYINVYLIYPIFFNSFYIFDTHSHLVITLNIIFIIIYFGNFGYLNLIYFIT